MPPGKQFKKRKGTSPTRLPLAPTRWSIERSNTQKSTFYQISLQYLNDRVGCLHNRELEQETVETKKSLIARCTEPAAHPSRKIPRLLDISYQAVKNYLHGRLPIATCCVRSLWDPLLLTGMTGKGENSYLNRPLPGRRTTIDTAKS